MAATTDRKSAQPLARLIGKVLDPVTAKRGFAAADLLAAWDDVIGPRYAPFTQPDKLTWPRGREGGGILTIRIDGARALFFQHESDQAIERINRFLGFAAVAELRLLHRPVKSRRKAAVPPPAPLPMDEASALQQAVAPVADDALREALLRLGEGVVRSRLAGA